MNYAVWPAANLINFKFVPPQQRVGYISMVAIGKIADPQQHLYLSFSSCFLYFFSGWNAFLSRMANK